MLKDQEKEPENGTESDVPLYQRRLATRFTSNRNKSTEGKKDGLKKKKLRSIVLGHTETPEEILDYGEDRKSSEDGKKSDALTLISDEEQAYLLKNGKKYTGLLRVIIGKSPTSSKFSVIYKRNNLEQNASSIEDPAGTDGANDVAEGAHQEQRSIEEVAENINLNENLEKSNSDHNDFSEEKISPCEEIGENVMDITIEKEEQNTDNSYDSNHYGRTEERHSGTNDYEEADASRPVYREEVEDLQILMGDTIYIIPEAKLITTCVNKDDNVPSGRRKLSIPQEYLAQNITKSSSFSNHSSSENELKPVTETTTGVDYNQLSTDVMNTDEVHLEELEEERENLNENNRESFNSPSQNLSVEHINYNVNESSSDDIPHIETEYVSLENLTENINICGTCSRRFRNTTDLHEHQSDLGHYQCNRLECLNFIFPTLEDVRTHESKVHGTSISSNIIEATRYLNEDSSSVNQNTLNVSRTPSIMDMHLPSTIILTNEERNNSPLRSEREINYWAHSASEIDREIMPPLNFEQLPAPLQQLTEQVQRMPPLQAPCLLPGTSLYSAIPADSRQSPTRSPVYRIPGSENIHYASDMTHLYPQYGSGLSQHQQINPQQMHPQLPHSTLQGQYQPITGTPSASSGCSFPRQRLKRTMQQAMPAQQQNNSIKQRRMDVLMPDTDEDADCRVIAQQKRDDGLPVIQNVQGACPVQPANKSDSTIHLTDSLTLSVRPSGSKGSSTSAQHQSASSSGSNQSNATALASVLAARGITVTPASNKNKTSEQNRQQSSIQLQISSTSQQSLNVPSGNLNSAISIVTSTSSQRRPQEQVQFVIPQNRSNKKPTSEVNRPPRPPTVDLTQDNTLQVAAVQRERSDTRAIQNLPTHRPMEHNPSSLSGDRVVQQNVSTEVAIPIVDLNDRNALTRLANLGINNYIPLSVLNAQAGESYVIPVMSTDSAGNPNVSNLAALGATSVLSLGTLRNLPNNG